MTVLCDDSIRVRQMIDPFFERTRQPNGLSYGLGPASYDIRAANGATILPGKFINISAVEYLKLPNDVAADIRVKSTWMRRGVLVANGWFDPGFEGHPTVVMTNHSAEVVTIRPLDPIAQLVFMMTDKPCRAPYAGRYQVATKQLVSVCP